MLIRGSRIISLALATSLLVISIVHACSGEDLVLSNTSVSASLRDSGMKANPCHKPKQDICKSVWYDMLSVREPISVADTVLHEAAPFDSGKFGMHFL